MKERSPRPKQPEEIFAHLKKVLLAKRFLKKEGLGNEIPFFIAPHDPYFAPEIERMISRLKKALESEGLSVLHVNLYALGIELLKGRGLLERILEEEQSFDKDELKDLLQNVLDPEQYLIPAIEEKMEALPGFHLLLLSGAGTVFPYIRTHNVLNNLQRVAKEKPTLLFFPGSYTQIAGSGSSLDLFGKLHDDKYYRAFDIFEYDI